MNENSGPILTVDAALKDPNPILFCSQDGSPITFHLETGKDEKRLIKAVRKVVSPYGGKYIEEYGDMTPYTVLLVTDDGFRKRKYNRPAVSITYVGDCISENSLLDINEYVFPLEEMEKWGPLNLFEVVYFFKEQFPGYMTPKKRKSSEGQSPAANTTAATMTTPMSLMSAASLLSPLSTDPPSEFTPVKTRRLNLAEPSPIRSDLPGPRDETRTQEPSAIISEKLPQSEPTAHEPVTKLATLTTEDDSAAKCPNIQLAEQQELCGQPLERTVSPLDKVSSSVNAEPAPTTVSASSTPATSRPFQKSPVSSTPSPKTPGESSPFPEFDDTIPEERPRRGRGAQDRYKTWEQRIILRYLADNQKFRNLKGTTVWKEMARKKILPNRPWQSLKNQFLKNLLKNLDKFPCLSDEERSKFLNPPAESSDDDDDDSSFFYAGDYNRQRSRQVPCDVNN